MATLIGPSHHLYYGALHRRRLWLEHVAQTFGRFASPGFAEAKRKLDQSFARSLTRLSLDGHLGIQHPLPLQRVLDDTPVDAFLARLGEELDAYEHDLFDLIQNDASKLEWRQPLEETSMLWGRGLAQETLIAMAAAGAPPSAAPRPESSSLKGISLVLHTVLQGGDFSWRSLLFRRRTDREVQYELRSCPHRKPTASKTSADLACRLESKVFEGFTLAFYKNARYERRSHESYCVDELRLEV